MTRAKDISKIITDADFSGTLDVAGNLTISGTSNFQNDITLTGASIAIADNEAVRFGAGQDLAIFHDGVGGGSYINEQGTGDLNIQAADILFKKYGTSEVFADFNADGAVQLYYDASKKFETTSTGIDITGEVTTTDDIKFTSGSRHKFVGGTGSNLELGVYSSSNTSRDVKMTIDSAGNVDVKSSGDATLKITAGGTSNDSKIDFVHGTTTDGGITFDHNGSFGSEQIIFRAGNNTPHVYIKGDGDVNHHTSGSFRAYRFNSSTNPYLNVGSIGCAYFNASSSDANAYAIVTNKDSSSTMHHICFKNINSVVGTISTSGSSTSYNTSSDHRLKENVSDMTGAIDRVKQLLPKRFNFIADDTDTLVDGFLAHEAQTVVAEAVTGTHNEVDDDGNPVYQGIDQSKLVPLLTGALKEAIAKIEELEARITTLEGN